MLPGPVVINYGDNITEEIEILAAADLRLVNQITSRTRAIESLPVVAFSALSPYN